MLKWRNDKAEKATESQNAEGTASATATAVVTPATETSQARPPRSTTPGQVGEMLVKEGVITAGQLDEALKLQAETGGFIGQVLVEMHYLDQNTLISFLVKQCKIPHISLVDYVVSDTLLTLVPKELCLKYNVLPIDKLGRILTLAMVNPLDVKALEQVRTSCPDLRIKPILCDWNHYESVARRFFHTEPSEAPEVTARSFGLVEQQPRRQPPARYAANTAEAAADALVIETAGSKTGPAVDGAKNDKSKQITASKKVPAVQSAGARSAPANWPAPPALANTIRTAIQEPLSALAKELRAAAAIHESQVRRATEAAIKAAHAAEAAIRMMEEDRETFEKRPTGETRITNLEVFPGPMRDGATTEELPAVGLDDTEALDSPGLGMDTDDRVREVLDSDQVLGRYTFARFIAGPYNAFVLKVARALGEELTRDFNPFYLFAEEGLGKTHLLNAIGNEALSRNPDLRVAYVSTSHFASAHAAAMKHDKLSEFRDRYCHWDMLLIDDVQFLANRFDTQEELFHVFNALTHEGRIVALAGDRAPEDLSNIRKGLVSRFSSGIVTRLRPPEMDVRLAILKRHAEVRRVAVSEEVLTLIATRIANDVRKMTGALRKVIAYAKLVEQDITREMADEVLKSLGIGEAA